MRTVIEYHEFIKNADKLFVAEEREKIVSFLSLNPNAGRKLDHFGGIRRLEWNDNAEYGIYFLPGANNLPLTVIALFRRREKLVLDKIIEILIHSKIG